MAIPEGAKVSLLIFEEIKNSSWCDRLPNFFITAMKMCGSSLTLQLQFSVRLTHNIQKRNFGVHILGLVLFLVYGQNI
jgi:hypothetical protein